MQEKNNQKSYCLTPLGTFLPSFEIKIEKKIVLLFNHVIHISSVFDLVQKMTPKKYKIP